MESDCAAGALRLRKTTLRGFNRRARHAGLSRIRFHGETPDLH